ncbi:MAG: hypothetical protein WD030_09005 [Pirellulales bacterium]
MPRIVALEWDSQEARVIVARLPKVRSREPAVVLEHAFDVDLAPRDSGGAVTETPVASRIRAALDSRGIGRGDVLVAIGRGNIELRMLSLPPAPPEELPTLVRFQAQRQFSQVADDWPLDFLPMGEESSGSQRVLAAALPPQTMRQIIETCAAADLKVTRLTLRAAEAGWLLSRQRQLLERGVTLFIDPLADEADLTVVDGEQVAVMRTVKLPEKSSESSLAAALLGEARRTMAAAQNQLGGRQVEQIVLCGANEENEQLAARLGEVLALPVELFQPFAGFELAGDLKRRLPRHPGRYAPLLGMLQAEAESAHPIDFLHPRQPPARQNRKRQLAFAGAAAAILLLLLAGWTWTSLSALDAELRDLQQQRADNLPLVEKAEALRSQQAELDAWGASDIDWLAELREMSADFPPPEVAILAKLQWVAKEAGGEMLFEGGVAGPEVLTRMEAALRDERHPEVAARGGQLNSDNAPYELPFRASLKVEAADVEARLRQRMEAGEEDSP